MLIAVAAILAMYNSFFGATDYRHEVAQCWETRAPVQMRIDACSTLLDLGEMTDATRAVFLRSRAWQHKNAGAYDLAIQDVDQAIVLDADNSLNWIYKAWINDRFGTRDDVLADFQQALQTGPNPINTYLNRADLFYGHEEYSAALDDYKRVLALEPEHRKATRNLAAVQINQGRYDAAIETLGEVTHLWPDDEDAYLALGVLYSEAREDFDAALSAFGAAVALDDQNAQAHIYLGLMWLKVGSESRGMAHIERFATLFSERSRAKEGLWGRALSWYLWGDIERNLFRAFALGFAGREDMARANYREFLVAGGAHAERALRNVLVIYEACSTEHRCDGPDGGLDAGLIRYIEKQGETSLLEGLAGKLYLR